MLLAMMEHSQVAGGQLASLGGKVDVDSLKMSSAEGGRHSLLQEIDPGLGLPPDQQMKDIPRLA